MIYIKDKKSTLCKGDFRHAQFYKGNKKIAGYTHETFEGDRYVELKNCYKDKIYNAKISGNCYQEGTPSPENPVPVMCVGDLVTSGEHSGKYKIGVVAYNGNGDEAYFDIYLDEPLCKVGSYEDYIDFEKKKVVRNTSIKVLTGVEIWLRQDYRLYLECGKRSGINSNEIGCNSNRFKAYPWVDIYKNSILSNKKIGIALQGGDYIVLTPAQTVPTVAEWKAQLKAWNDEGKPFTVVHADATREEELDLPTLHTFGGTTHYEVITDIPAKLSGEYKKME